MLYSFEDISKATNIPKAYARRYASEFGISGTRTIGEQNERRMLRFTEEQVSVMQHIHELYKKSRVEIIKEVLHLEDELAKAREITHFEV